MCGICGYYEFGKHISLHSGVIQKNIEITTQEIINLMGEFYSGNINYDRLCMLLSDSHPYVTGKWVFESLFPNLEHVTCLANILHRLCGKLREYLLNTIS